MRVAQDAPVDSFSCEVAETNADLFEFLIIRAVKT